MHVYLRSFQMFKYHITSCFSSFFSSSRGQMPVQKTDKQTMRQNDRERVKRVKMRKSEERESEVDVRYYTISENIDLVLVYILVCARVGVWLIMITRSSLHRIQ